MEACQTVICLKGWMVVMLLALASTLNIVIVGVDCVTKTMNSINSKSILKTIKLKDGEVIDCVDIYKQPAFSHPLLTNHTLQLKPSSYPFWNTEKDSSNSTRRINISWDHKGEYCPRGTIPIARYQVAFPHKNKQANEFTIREIQTKHAQVTMTGDKYYGGGAKLNAWNPTVIAPGFSLAQIWLAAGRGTPKFSTVEAGWMSDNYTSTGCYNLECPGFVQTSQKFGLGTPVKPISEYNGTQYDTSIQIYKDMTSGHWWLRIQGEDIGYWPSQIFNGGFSESSTVINWGGEITNTNPQGFHTQTDMGSGHFASEGFGKAAFMRNMEYVDQDGIVKDAHDLYPYTSRPECYSVAMQDWNDSFGMHFYYGGPGYSNSCK
ncbi:hypothetical protein LINPERPRIM_LOCUS1182 [Linum perenne]